RSVNHFDTVVSGLVQVPDPKHSDLTIDVYRLDPGDDQTAAGFGVIRPKTVHTATGFTIPAADATNPSSFGEGRAWVGTVPQSAILDDGRWHLTVPGPVDPGAAFTATVTDSNGDTSEFSAFCSDIDRNGTGDNDGDGLCDDWEKYGIDLDG